MEMQGPRSHDLGVVLLILIGVVLCCGVMAWALWVIAP